MKGPSVTPGERRALLFFAALLVLAIGARAAEGRRLRQAVPVADSLALERQLRAIDDAGRARKAERPGGGGKRTRRGRGRKAGGDSAAAHPPGPVSAMAAPAPGPTPVAVPAFASGSSSSSSTSRTPTPARVDLDVAPYEEIVLLPRVGPTLAARIVADRADHGPFGAPAALLGVRGVGPSLLKRLEPHVTFSGPPRRVLAGRPERRKDRAPP